MLGNVCMQSEECWSRGTTSMGDSSSVSNARGVTCTGLKVEFCRVE